MNATNRLPHGRGWGLPGLAALAAWAAAFAVGPPRLLVAEEAKIDYSEVVAIVNTEKITRGDLAEALILVSGHRALDVLVKRTLINQEARRLGITITRQEILQGIKDRVEDLLQIHMRDAGFEDIDSFSRFLQERQTTVDALRAKIRAGLSPDVYQETEAVRKALKLIEANVTVTQDEIRAEFAKQYGPQVMASQIVLRTRREAEDIARSLRRGASFEQLARTRSIDRRSALRGGKMQNPIKPSDAHLWAAVESLEKGQISSAVRSQSGYHILRVDGITGGKDVKLAAVKDKLTRQIRERKSREYLDTWYVRLLEKYDVRKMLRVHRPAILGDGQP